MANFSIDMENRIINHFLAVGTVTRATEHFVALFTSSDGTLESNDPDHEVTGSDYARIAVTFGTTTLGTTENAAAVTFATAGDDWGTITHIAIVDHLDATNWGTGVNVVMWGTLTATKAVASGDTFTIPAGDLDIDVD